MDAIQKDKYVTRSFDTTTFKVRRMAMVLGKLHTVWQPDTSLTNTSLTRQRQV